MSRFLDVTDATDTSGLISIPIPWWLLLPPEKPPENFDGVYPNPPPRSVGGKIPTGAFVPPFVGPPAPGFDFLDPTPPTMPAPPDEDLEFVPLYPRVELVPWTFEIPPIYLDDLPDDVFAPETPPETVAPSGQSPAPTTDASPAKTPPVPTKQLPGSDQVPGL